MIGVNELCYNGARFSAKTTIGLRRGTDRGEGEELRPMVAIVPKLRQGIVNSYLQGGGEGGGRLSLINF